MSKPLNPTLFTLLLSVAAIGAYLGFRVLNPGADNSDPAAVTSGPDPSQAAATARTAPIEQLPDFSLADLDGNPTPISQWRGRPMLINFWATWCAPCLREIPLLKEFQTEEPQVRVVGIAVDRFDPVVAFAEEMDFNYPVLVGQSDAMNAAAAFGVDVFALPFTVFTNADGSILGVHTGEIHPAHLHNLIAVLADLDAGQIELTTARDRIAGYQ